MAVARMRYVSVYGPEQKLQSTLGRIARLGCFAPEGSEAIHSALRASTNHYEPLLTKAKGLLKDLGHSSIAPDYVGTTDRYELAEVADFLETYAVEVARRSKRKTDIENEIEMYGKTAELLGRMTDIDVNLEDLFRVETMKVRVGRLPKNSYVRLNYYSEKGFNFTSYFNFMVYDFDGEFYWGMYFAPAESAGEIDEIFDSLYFERTWVPDFVHGKPEEALSGIDERKKELEQELASITTPVGIASEEELQKIQEMTAWLNYMNQLYDMKKYALAFNHTFYISGFVPASEYGRFEQLIEEIDAVHIQKAGRKQQVPAAPPVKLRNRWFARPYQMYTEMYGLPAYNDIDPTGMVAVLYSVLYGLMFADLGQGLVLGLFGYFVMYKLKNMEIGRILARASVFCCLFGILFGSFFGNEEIILHVWMRLGIPGHPFHPMAASSVNTILMVSIAIGVAVTALAIFTGILTKFRRGAVGSAVTSPNGIAGFVFYVSLVALLLDKLFLNIGFSAGAPYLLLLIVAPLLMIFFSEPLTELIGGKKVGVRGFVGAIGTGFFELFVSVLEYLSNTVSFLRVGGFILVHGGMMSVVNTLAGLTGGGAARVLVMILGNVVVICLEGLLVAIQALRLNYFELFSRFYEADGVPFEPLRIQSDTVEL